MLGSSSSLKRLRDGWLERMRVGEVNILFSVRASHVWSSGLERSWWTWCRSPSQKLWLFTSQIDQIHPFHCRACAQYSCLVQRHVFLENDLLDTWPCKRIRIKPRLVAGVRISASNLEMIWILNLGTGFHHITVVLICCGLCIGSIEQKWCSPQRHWGQQATNERGLFPRTLILLREHSLFCSPSVLMREVSKIWIYFM